MAVQQLKGRAAGGASFEAMPMSALKMYATLVKPPCRSGNRLVLLVKNDPLNSFKFPHLCGCFGQHLYVHVNTHTVAVRNQVNNATFADCEAVVEPGNLIASCTLLQHFPSNLF